MKPEFYATVNEEIQRTNQADKATVILRICEDGQPRLVTGFSSCFDLIILEKLLHERASDELRKNSVTL